MKSGAHCALLVMSAVLCAVAAVSPPPLEACTLWAAAGDRAAREGCLIAKNRDWVPEPAEVRLVSPSRGFRFLGLFPVRDGRRRGAVAGVNEKGLVVVTATVGSIRPGERAKGASGLTGRLLAGFASLEAVLADRASFQRTHPAIYLLADAQRIAWIEVAPGGRLSVRTTDSGVLAHTNHYLDEALTGLNRQVGRSSRKRLERIGLLLEGHPQPLNREDFIAFSRDGQDGADDSLWRTGSRPEGRRTLASWVVSLPRDAPPELFVRLANPGEAERTLKATLDGPFWMRTDERIF